MEPTYPNIVNAAISGPYRLGFVIAPTRLARKLKMAGEIVYGRVMQKKYSDTTLPYWLSGDVFWIMVIAGPEYVPCASTENIKQTIESQKLVDCSVAVHSKIGAIAQPEMHTSAFVMRLLFSNLSEIIPPAIEAVKPKQVWARALNRANSAL